MASAWIRKTFSLVIGIGILVIIIAWLAGAFETKSAPGLAPLAKRGWEGQPVAVVDKIRSPAVQEAVGTLKAAARTQIPPGSWQPLKKSQ